MKKIRVLIVDDEEPARLQIEKYLAGKDNFEIIGQCENAFEAMKCIQGGKPDLIFLDIQMPRISGMEMLEMLDDPPHIIFSTAYNDYAVRAFEINAVDYLLKPYTRSRFETALSRAVEKIKAGERIAFSALQQKMDEGTETISRVIVKKAGSMHIVPLADIICLEAKGDYVQLCTNEHNFMKQKTLQYFEDHLPDDRFLRVHRSFIINLEHLRKIEAWGKETRLALMNNGHKALVSKKGMAALKVFL